MHFKKFLVVLLLLSLFLGACDININLDKKKSNGNENENTQQHTNNNQTENIQNGQSQNNNQSSDTLSIERAKNIAYQTLNESSSPMFKKSDLKYREDKSDVNQIFIESPLHGINGSAKSHVVLNRYTGEVIEQDGGPPAPDGPLRPENGQIDNETYNVLVKYYNNYVYRQGDTVYEYSNQPVSTEQYSKLSKIVWRYIEKNTP
ncbi:hypothetical protein MT341_00540 [Staphylococcus sp. NRL 18/288]|nr:MULTISPECIES: hypothetical protein [unclassified Staphylococcus]MCJ1661109.1 hypothetical protein [Staphylococcus sp. NRL 18/288]MCJ1667006.1 hypothetical protein [Staphylococcus sp. NRL 19/737]